MDKFKISRIQEQFWLLQKVYAENTAYNISSVFHIKGKLNLRALNKAIHHVIFKHEILRSYFQENNNQVYQVVLDRSQINLPIAVEPIRDGNDSGMFPKSILNEINIPFKLDHWPLFRMKLFQEKDDHYFLTIVFHHILIDLHSKNIFAKELSAYYETFNHNLEFTEEIVSDAYTAYSKWEQEWMFSNDAKRLIARWNDDMVNPAELLELPADFPPSLVNSLNGKRLQFRINPVLSDGIQQIARDFNTNTYAILLSAYAILLHRLTNQKRINIGIPLSNRKNEAFKEIFGCLVNIVPIFLEFESEDTFETIIKKVRTQLLIAHRRQEIPFLDIFELFRHSNSGKTKQLFQAGFAFEPPMQLLLEQCDVESLPIERDGSQLDIFLTLWPKRDEFLGFIECSTQKFSEQTIYRYKEIYLKIVETFTTQVSCKIQDINILPDSDVYLLQLWNNTDMDYHKDLCLHQKFEQQVTKTPKRTALIFNNQSLTYEELEKHANRTANFLIRSGVNIEDRISVCQERSLEMIICILGIHKAGATYVPVDPNYPFDRMKMILDDADPKVIFTKRGSDTNIPDKFSKIYVDDILSNPLSFNDEKPIVGITAQNLAYIIYTSGSTGKPKGVMIEHHSVINKIEWMQFQHPLNESDTLLLRTPVTFDVSVWELFWWFFNGSRLAILAPRGEKDPKTMIETVEKNKVTLIIFVPSLFLTFVGYLEAYHAMHRLKSLKWIIQIGEALSPQLVNSFNKLRSEDFAPIMVNTYGPAEATVAVTFYNCPTNEVVKNVYIGKPIFNTKIVILNKNNKILPIGIPGELAITGVNLSRGYINLPQLNDEKFIEIEYLNGEKIRAYRTGDLAKWLDNGNLDFIGRVDNQVKIRGFRIELGDIEAVMQQCPIVNSAAVIVDNSNPDNKLLIGYVTLKGEKEGSMDIIRNFLQNKLPDYMIPPYILILDEMPLNQSEKIDRKALPKPVKEHKIIDIVPNSYYEIQLSKVWKKTLNLDQVGLLDNFFDMGGNSLLAILITNEIKISLNISIEPIKLMEFPTIRDLSGYIHAIENNKDELVISQQIRKQNYSPIRNRRLK